MLLMGEENDHLFLQPGTRWLRQQVLGRETIQEVKLIDGREHPGQNSWILTFEGIDTVEQVSCFLILELSFCFLIS